MKTIDLTQLSQSEWSNGSYLWNMKNLRDCPHYIGDLKDEEIRLILPSFEDITLHWSEIIDIPLVYNTYEGGCYLGSAINPYHIFVKPEPGAKKIVIPKSTKEVFNLSSCDYPFEELIVEAEEITFDSYFGGYSEHRRRVEFKPGKKLYLQTGCFTKSSLEELFIADRDCVILSDGCFSRNPGLGKGKVRIPYSGVRYYRECFQGCHLKAAYIDAEVNELLDCFDENTVIFYGGDPSKLRTHHSFRLVQTGEWDGNPHHPVPSEVVGSQAYGDTRPNTVGHAKIEDFEEYLRNH